MNTPSKTQTESSMAMMRGIVLAVLFVALTLLLCLGFRQDEVLETELQRTLYPMGVGLVLASLAVVWLWMQTGEEETHLRLTPCGKRWLYPVIAGVLGLTCMVLAYLYLGIWPVGDRSAMIVDMHHQYAPLLSQLRDMLLHGGDPLYSFNIGLGTSFLPLFGYYLASPFNLLLVLFPEHLLTEGILVITLLKNALSAAFFAAMLQYIYKKRNPVIPAVAIMYSLMMYLLAYSWNIMWLDVVMVLPLVVLLFERMMRTGKYAGYILVLAYALFANYYIAFMLCVFLVLYFVVWAAREKRDSKEITQGFTRFAIGSAIGGGLVMALLVPVYIGLQQTSAAGGNLPEMAANFPFFDLLGQHLFRTDPTIRSGNLPNIYCGLLPVLLLPLFATTKDIPLRRRVCYIGLLAVMAFSCVINQMDLVWHGLHSPNDLPYRFSFLYSFVLLLIGYETLLHIQKISLKQVGYTLAGGFVFLVLLERVDEDYTFDNIYISLLLLAVYAVVVALVARKKWSLRPAYMFLTLVVTAEMLMNAGLTMRQLHADEYFTAHKDYVDNEITESLREVVAEVEARGDAAYPNGFYRMEFLPRRTTVDPALFDYRGMTVFASSNPYNTVKFMGNLGYAINGVNSYLYRSFIPSLDSMLGINYVVLENELTDHPQLQLLGSTTTGSKTQYIYQNPYALPLGYMVEEAVRQWVPTDYDPITSQNDLFRRLTGIEEDMYTLHPAQVTTASEDFATVTEGASSGTDTAFSVSGKDRTAYFTVTLPTDGQTVIYVDCRAAESLSASQGDNYWNITTHEPFLIDAGTLKAGNQVEITVETKDSCIGNIYVATLNEDVFARSFEKLAKNGLQVTSFSDSRIEGTVTADKGGLMMTSMTYDKGWKVLVDGKEVIPVSTQMQEAADTGTVGMAEALLCFEVPAGTHTVTMVFFPEGLGLGLALSGISLLAFLLLLLWPRLKKKPAPVAVPLHEMVGDVVVVPTTEEEGSSLDELDAALLFADPEEPKE